MLYFRLEQDELGLEVAEVMTHEAFHERFRGKHSEVAWAKQHGATGLYEGWIDRNGIETFCRAQILAESASKLDRRYVATDAGSGVYPRYDVIEAPMVGDEVSYGFNGDYYPCGKIVKVTESLNTVTTDDGTVFRRRGDTGAWKKTGGTWTMVRGSVDERNPSF